MRPTPATGCTEAQAAMMTAKATQNVVSRGTRSMVTAEGSFVLRPTREVSFPRKDDLPGEAHPYYGTNRFTTPSESKKNSTQSQCAELLRLLCVDGLEYSLTASHSFNAQAG